MGSSAFSSCPQPLLLSPVIRIDLTGGVYEEINRTRARLRVAGALGDHQRNLCSPRSSFRFGRLGPKALPKPHPPHGPHLHHFQCPAGAVPHCRCFVPIPEEPFTSAAASLPSMHHGGPGTQWGRAGPGEGKTARLSSLCGRLWSVESWLLGRSW